MRALALLPLALLLAGCSTDRDDRAFFSSGWVHPEAGAHQRMYGSHEKISLDKKDPQTVR